MSTNLLFDENFGKPIVEALARLMAFHPDRPRVEHLINFERREGAKDEEWIPKAAEGDWVIVTCDRGAHGASKLPRICRQYKVTHVLLVGRLVHRQQFERIRAILVVWPGLIMATDKPPGSRFKLKATAGHPVLEFVEVGRSVNKS